MRAMEQGLACLSNPQIFNACSMKIGAFHTPRNEASKGSNCEYHLMIDGILSAKLIVTYQVHPCSRTQNLKVGLLPPPFPFLCVDRAQIYS